MESHCSNFSLENFRSYLNFCVPNAIVGGIGVVLCIAALIIVLVNKFYQDIVQRLIMYKLNTVAAYYLGLLIISAAGISGGSEYIHKILAADIGGISYCANSVLTLSLTIILYRYTVHLKELGNFKKLEPVAIIIIMCLSFLFLFSFICYLYDGCKQELQNNSFEHVTFNELPYIAGYYLGGLLHFISTILIAIIIIKLIKRSRSPLQGQDDNQAESPLLTSNRWKALSKQLLPLVMYPIVNTIAAVIVFYIATRIYMCKDRDDDDSHYILAEALLASLELITSIVIILHLVILKCTKRGRRKRRRRKEWEESQEALCIMTSNHNDVFTNETIASTDASTSYLVPRTTSLTLSQLPVN